MKKFVSTRTLAVLALALAGSLLAVPASRAQFPGMQPKTYPWSDTSLSPYQRADLVIKEMTLDKKISLLHGQGMALFLNKYAAATGNFDRVSSAEART